MKKLGGLKLCLILCLVLASLALTGCFEVSPIDDEPQEEDKVQLVIQEINLLPDEILKSDINQVIKVERMYNKLSEQEKKQVTNYEMLEKAIEEKNYLQDIDEILQNEFENVERFLNEQIPETIGSFEDKIDLPSTYIYKDSHQTVLYRITYQSSEPDIISNNGVVNHLQEDTYVDLLINVKCSYNGIERLFTKRINVERSIVLLFDHQILVAYWYGKFKQLTDIDYESIDIINYCFGQIAEGDNGWYISGRLSNLTDFTKVKEKGIKVCLSLGGWHDDKSFWDIYAKAASTEENRIAVANAILDVVVKYNLDGIDMDWEYPTSKNKNNFTLLMKQINKTLKEYNEDYLVTAAIPAGDWVNDRFDLASLNDVLDLFYVMTYDLDDGMRCNHVSSLSDAKDAVAYFQKYGVADEKIIIGSAFYGRYYEGVEDNGKGGLGASATYKDEISYDDILKNYLSRLGSGVTKYYDEKEEAYYLYDSTNKLFISYEDTESVIDKWNYAVNTGIGGLMYWSYDNDFSNTLMKAINSAQKANKQK